MPRLRDLNDEEKEMLSHAEEMTQAVFLDYCITLRELRRRGVSPSRMAEHVGCTPQTVHNHLKFGA